MPGPEPVDHPRFSRLYRIAEGPLEQAVGPLRRAQNAQARGRVLVLGAGTGLDVPALVGSAMTAVTLLEPDRAMRNILGERYPGLPILPATAESIPCPDRSFDTVIGSLLLCTVADVPQVLREITRLLAPGGSYLFLEHVRNPAPLGGTLQAVLDPAWRYVAGGCRLRRDPVAAIRASPLSLEAYEGSPVGGLFPLVRGRASNPAGALKP